MRGYPKNRSIIECFGNITAIFGLIDAVIVILEAAIKWFVAKDEHAIFGGGEWRKGA